MPYSSQHRVRAFVGKARTFLEGYPGWVGGVLTGLQGALIPYLTVVVLSLAVIVSDPGASTSAGVEWNSAFSAASMIWLMAHGLPATAGGVTFTLLPAGLTVLCCAVVAACARRFATRSWMSWGLATGTYVAWVVVIGSISLGSTPEGGGQVVRAATVAALMAGASAAWGIWRAHGATFEWLLDLSDWFVRGLRRGAGTLAWLMAAAGVASVVTVVMHGDEVAASATGLGVDVVGGVVLAVGQLAFVPTFMVWMLAYIAGPGFSVGEGTAYAPGVVQADALPDLPLFAALPTAEASWLVWLPLLVVVVAGVARGLTRTGKPLEWADAAADAVALVVVIVVTAGLAAMASGAIGPGRLETTGPDIVSLMAAMGMLVFAGYVIATGVLAAWLWWQGRQSQREGESRRSTMRTAAVPASPAAGPAPPSPVATSRATSGDATSAESPVTQGAQVGSRATPSAPSSARGNSPSKAPRTAPRTAPKAEKRS
ncbi:cell division protein PerM [Demequina sediminicola]|uniref:cell division protein PerM n=1 Tax=Demequina sediminicola TaxID=1095026 RepID=UPI0007826D2F|nr:DUF6350 family protein [Demequina sediminicola]